LEDVPIIIRSYGIGIYGRFSAIIALPNGKDFATVVKENGFSKLGNY